MFKKRTGCYLEILTPETMKLLASTKNKITQDESGKNLPFSFMVTEVVLVHCNIVQNDYQ